MLDLEPGPGRVLTIPCGPVPAARPGKPPVGPERKRDQTLDIIGTINVVHDGRIVPAPERGQNAPMQGCIPRVTVHSIFMSNHVCNAQILSVPNVDRLPESRN